MLETQRPTVVGVFHDRLSAERAVDELRRLGIAENRIGLIAREVEAATGTASSGTQWGEGAATGAVAGGATGTLLGIAVAAGLIPGVGPAVAGGILAGLLASAATGAVTGGILGALIGLGIPEEEAAYYQGEFTAGRVLVTVKVDGQAAQIRDVLRRHGAYDTETAPQDRPFYSVHPTGGIEAATLPHTAAGKEALSERADLGAGLPRTEAARRLDEDVARVSPPNMPPGV